MNARNPAFIAPVDVHAALARAHADRAEYIGMALAGVPALFKRVAAAFRERRTAHKGAWA